MKRGLVWIGIFALAAGTAGTSAADGQGNTAPPMVAQSISTAQPGATSDADAGGFSGLIAPLRDRLSGALPPVIHGIATLETLIGDAYYYGHWVSRDYAEAGRWYRRAAASGNAMAASTLGDMYYYGRDVPQDYAGAVMWWQTAAARGVAIAQLNLSVMYANGDGVEQDYVKSHMYANLASAHLPLGEDRDIAIKNRDIIAKSLTPAQLAEAQRMASEWRPKDSE